MGEDYRRALREIRKRLAADEQGMPRFDEPPTSASPAEKDDWHDQRMKAAVAAGNVVVAHGHAVALERSESRAQRVLASERLRLFATRPASVPAGGPNLNPGVVYVSGLGTVAVLGRYEAYGARAGLTEALLILKKASEELDDVTRNARPSIIERLGGQLGNVLRVARGFGDVDFIVPTPPDPGRFAARLYHPPTEVVRALGRYALIPTFNDVLIKTRATRKLKDLDRHEREVEIHGSMAIADDRTFLVGNRTVLVLDDIVTWGTHFREATRVLRAAGAGQIRFAAVATAHGVVTPAE